jgi:hypothetical protein
MNWWQFCDARPLFSFVLLVCAAVWLAWMWTITWDGASKCMREMLHARVD